MNLRPPCLVPVATLLVLLLPAVTYPEQRDVWTALTREYVQQLQPLLAEFCCDCHSSESREGELDLQRFATLDDVRRDPAVFQRVDYMLEHGEMPPDGSVQPTPDQRRRLREWAGRYLEVEARTHDGDPGPVVLRRLNNAEYTYTVRDLTGIELDPAKEFPVDSAAGEGFTNTGDALAMSPSLVTKYLDAAKGVAGHMVLLPDDIRFSSLATRRDWTDEIVRDIRSIYLRHTTGDGDVSRLDQWSVADPTQITLADGRVDLVPYFVVLIARRAALQKDLGAAEALAGEHRLNAKYLRCLAAALVSDRADAEESSVLVERIRARLRQAVPEDAAEIAALVRAWQDRLWKFNAVGHFGTVRPWQEAVSPLRESVDLRVRIEAGPAGDDVVIALTAESAGDEGEADVVQWWSPRIERPGRPTVLLRDVRPGFAVMQRKRQESLEAIPRYLAAAFHARTAADGQDVTALAAAHQLDPEMLRQWLRYLGIATVGEVTITNYLDQPLTGQGGNSSIRGWMRSGVADLSLISNATDEKVRLPGELGPHAIGVHPRPEQWVAVGWRSPLAGQVRVEPRLKDVHATCGNGVSWSLEFRRGSQRRVLRSGHVELGGLAVCDPVDDLTVEPGDLISLIVDARDRNHVCDLTEIELAVTDVADGGKQWSLTRDCADTIAAGNPHADRFGNEGIWHFYSGTLDGAAVQEVIPTGSLVARWLDAADPHEAAQFAREIAAFVAAPLPDGASAAEKEIYRQLTALDGPLFSHLDVTQLAAQAEATELATAEYGLARERFGRHPDGSVESDEHLIVRAPSVLRIRLPASLVAGGEFAVSGTLHGRSSGDGSVQLSAVLSEPSGEVELRPGADVIVRSGSGAETRWQRAFDEFRSLFPASMCHARIVPVDEVVTLVLFHREDQHLARLMLDADEAARLDRLWDELRYVSQDALTSVTAFEQLMEFATQDGDPSLFEPLRESIKRSASALQQRLIASEPLHLDALLAFASRAYRRPLGQDEDRDLRAMYDELRRQAMSHDEALRLVLARVLVAPAFLYRLETAADSAEPVPVSDWELASRLSYFLWSSLPDAELRQLAAAGRLRDETTLIEQANRMRRDDRARRFAIEFGCQWLHVRDFDQMDEKSERHFPTFSTLRGAMYEESILFLTDLVQNDRSVLSILDADHTFLNEALARHYGVEGVSSQQWRRVDGVRQYGRGGILAHATVLTKQSGASRTSPILRGNWVSETLLGERLPRPPKNVPQLPETVPQGLTERQLIEKHTDDPACAKCHVRIDPYGFALESYDAIGRYRASDAGGHAIDTQTKLMDGTVVEGIDGLRDYLVNRRRDTFVRHFCRKLLGYALGRGVQLSDEPLLDRITARLAENDYRFSVAVEAIVASRQFRMVRGRAFAHEGLADRPEGE